MGAISTDPPQRTTLTIKLDVPVRFEKRDGVVFSYVDVNGSKRITGTGSEAMIAFERMEKQLKKYLKNIWW
jgi:hypothetical protein